MENLVQNYINQISKLQIPEDERSILDFLSKLDTPEQKMFQRVVLSQSHIYYSMHSILKTQYDRDFYESCGYAYRGENIVPKINQDGTVYYEELTPHSKMDIQAHEILDSLQKGDKTIWLQFVQYIKSIYDPDKMDIYRNIKNERLNHDMQIDFSTLNHDRYSNDKLKQQLEEMDKNPMIIPEKGIIGRIKYFFTKRKLDNDRKKIKSQIKDDTSYEEKALELIDKYKKNPDVPILTKKHLELAEKLIKAGLPQEVFTKVLLGLTYSMQTSSSINYDIFKMQKHLQASCKIAQKMYSPEIIYAKSFQDMTKEVRKLLTAHEIKEDAELSTEYRTIPLKNRLNATEDISNVLKGKNLSQAEIKVKMEELDKEFEKAQQESDPEQYIRKCTQISMKFISIHPFDDGNGRTSRILLQTMLARRGILLPSPIENYFDRQHGTRYTRIEDECLRTENYTKIEDYIIEKVKQYNNGELQLNDEQLVLPNNSKQIEKSTQKQI